MQYDLQAEIEAYEALRAEFISVVQANPCGLEDKIKELIVANENLTKELLCVSIFAVQ
ncbi:MAG: hypothetical protein V3V68_05010 [Nitrosomonadaceae bacterium]